MGLIDTFAALSLLALGLVSLAYLAYEVWQYVG